MAEQRKYDFTNGFQHKAAAALIKDPMILSTCRDAIDEAYFEDRPTALIVGAAIAYYDQHYALASRYVLEQYVRERCVALNLPPTLNAEVYSKFTQLASTTVTDVAWITEKLADFGNFQALRGAILGSITKLEDGSAQMDPNVGDEIVSMLQEAACVGRGAGGGIDVYDHLANPQGLIAADPVFDPRYKAPTSIETLNRITHGGTGAGELGIIVGASKRGKSQILANFAGAAARHGKRVFYATYELKPGDVAGRVMAFWTGLDFDVILSNSPEAIERLTGIHQRRGDRALHVEYFPPARSTAGHLRASVMKLAARTGKLPQAVYVDYIDEMSVGGRRGIGDSVASETYHAYGHISRDLIQLGYDLRAPVWTATQMGRAHYNNESPDLDSVGESLKKMTKADCIILLAQTKAMKEENRLDLIVRQRRGADGMRIPCRTEYHRSRLVEITEEIAAQNDAMLGQQPTADGPAPANGHPAANGQWGGVWTPPPAAAAPAA